jgi:hypothetical protein
VTEGCEPSGPELEPAELPVAFEASSLAEPLELVAEGRPALDPVLEPAPELEPAALEPLLSNPGPLSLEEVGCGPSPDELPFWPLPLELVLPLLSFEPVPDGCDADEPEPVEEAPEPLS